MLTSFYRTFAENLNMEFTVAQIAEILSADVVGNPEAIIKSVSKIEEGCDGALTFLANPKYTHFIYETKATAAIVNRSFVPEKPVPCILIKVDDAYTAFATLLNFYNNLKNNKKGISPLACIDESATIGKDVYIGEFVSIGANVVIGDEVKLFPHVCIGDHARVGARTTLHSGVKMYAECQIGQDCIVHAGSVIGADGFGFAAQDGSFLKVPQIGNVVIEDGVEIGANTCIDRATMGSTIIHANVKLDNLIQIAHNVEVGEGSAFAAQCGVAGSAKIGKHCIFGGQTAVNGHIAIGNNVMVGACSAVAASTQDNEMLFGRPAIPHREEQKLIIYRKKLPELYNRVAQLEKLLKEKE